jgi:uncharacterized protein (TIGR00255 family)
MIYSMTGFGKSQKELQDLQIRVEVKSLNSKFTDIFCRVPKSLSAKEIDIRNYLTQQLERGKMELNLHLQKNNENVEQSILPQGQIATYFAELKRVATELGISNIDENALYLQAMSMPSLNATDHSQDAVKECKEFRAREGKVVEDKFREYIAAIKSGLAQVLEQDKIRMPGIRERMRNALLELGLKEDFDQNRFEQEVVYYIEKFDISEEKVRLATHLDYFIEILEEGNGKKLNFMAQEIGREINTIGSKANDSTIQRLVVNMKDELEKIKEQTANVL